MPTPHVTRHLQLVQNAARPRPSLWLVLVCGLGIIALTWYIAGWRLQAAQEAWWQEYEARRLQALPMVRIECLDARGRAFSKDLTVSLADAERVVELIELSAPTGEPAMCWPRRL